MAGLRASLDDQGSNKEFADFAAGANGGAVVEVLADVLQADRPLDVAQVQRAEIGEEIGRDLAAQDVGMRRRLGVDDDRTLKSDPGVPRRGEIGVGPGPDFRKLALLLVMLK